ncbi:DUF3849 domain-containing protein [Pseudoflavonifractor sp. 60]|uniref:DUF3849 domain-containing protein n=1 Tax=Pseudoflavonifractor sp. 60 TaxID=2304576 RepID=UPI00136CFF32|nr:DUF3849 domain-containing protein [Pseudoflavonifractor sp. 60]NBI65961.1 DUF3849 domain-containing protein [Pseudoflavonifractor sp. 60]
MAADFPYVYPNSCAEARRHKETQMHEDSFRLNVSCARAIEQAIRDHFDESAEELTEGCAQAVLEQYGFKRVNFVLANSLKELRQSSCEHLISEEAYQWSQRTFVSSDGKYNRYYAVDTAAKSLEAFVGQAREAYQALGLFGLEHCASSRLEAEFKGKVLVLSPNTLREGFWDPRNQLWYGEGGFGCSPTSSGRAVFATCLGDGEKTRWNRADFIGVLDERYLPDWAQEELAELRGPQQENTASPTVGGMTMT